MHLLIPSTDCKGRFVGGTNNTEYSVTIPNGVLQVQLTLIAVNVGDVDYLPHIPMRNLHS